MAHPDTAGPAIAHDEPTLNFEQVGRPLNHPDTPNASEAQAPPDDRGESDFAFFTARPHARHRIRAPFPREFPPEFLTHRDGGTAVITVVIERDAAGRPTRRGRGIAFIPGGSA